MLDTPTASQLNAVLLSLASSHRVPATALPPCCLQTLVERDSAISKAEELTIKLNAAHREIAALRNQISRQQQDIIQLKMQASHANAAAVAAGAGGRSTGLGLRSSINSMRGISPSLGPLGHYTSSPPKGLGLAPGAGFGVSGRPRSPVYGVAPRPMTTGGLSDAWRAGVYEVGGHAVSAGGAEEVQVGFSTFQVRECTFRKSVLEYTLECNGSMLAWDPTALAACAVTMIHQADLAADDLSCGRCALQCSRLHHTRQDDGRSLQPHWVLQGVDTCLCQKLSPELGQS